MYPRNTPTVRHVACFAVMSSHVQSQNPERRGAGIREMHWALSELPCSECVSA